MASAADRYAVRRQEIRDRLDAIRNRLEAIADARTRAQPRYLGAELMSEATFQVEAEECEARATDSLMRALRWSAQAHRQAALAHERAVAAGAGDVAEHQRRADFHRAAAMADEDRSTG